MMSTDNLLKSTERLPTNQVKATNSQRCSSLSHTNTRGWRNQKDMLGLQIPRVLVVSDTKHIPFYSVLQMVLLHALVDKKHASWWCTIQPVAQGQI